MKQLEFCTYPPQVAADVEISPRIDGETTTFVVGSPEAGRYLSLGVVEHRVIQLLDGTAAPAAVCFAMEQRYGVRLQLPAMTRFLSKLDAAGVLAGKRIHMRQAALPGNRFYLHWKLFDPDPLFSRIVPLLRWIWTSGFLAASLLLMLVSAVIAVANWTEIVSYGSRILREHYPTVLIVTWLVVISHEFAHGLTAKAFGGRATEIGVLLIYYCLPALYCNVSGLYLIPQRRHRLWVIAAGIYWQLLVGSVALLAWFLLAPHTLPADVAMLFVLGSVLNVVFNTNPLIKLDGYYFLSQWLRLPNLMDRSRACWRIVLHGSAEDESPGGAKLTSRERKILLPFGLLSFIYNLMLPLVIFWYTLQYLTEQLHLLGLLLSIMLGLMYVKSFLKKSIRTVVVWTFQRIRRGVSKNNMATDQAATKKSNELRWRRRLVLGAPVILVAIASCIPWSASVGGYGVLMTIPDQETAVRAPENGSVISLNVRPGQHVEKGSALGLLGNLDLEEQIVQARTDFARATAEAERLSGELRLQRHEAVSAELRSTQRRHEFTELEAEEGQIHALTGSGPQTGNVLVSFSTDGGGVFRPPATGPAQFPAVLAALEADADVRRAKLSEANSKLQRSRQLFAEGILAASEFDAANSNASSLAAELAEARHRLNAALVDHRRRHDAVENEFNLSRSSLLAADAQIVNLRTELQATSRLTASLQERLELLERKRKAFALTAPASGTVFGEDLFHMDGRYLLKGDAICRIVRLRELLVRVQVPEREIGDVKVGDDVRLKARAFPSRIFHGVVSRIGGEADLDQNHANHLSRRTHYTK